jgi:uncharacterized protein (DUF2141 family)
MKKFQVSSLLSLVFIVVVSGASLSKQTSDKCKIKILFTGVKEKKGQLRSALFNDSKGFPEDQSKAIKMKSMKTESFSDEEIKKGIIVEYDNLDAGVYAIGSLWDKNSNNKLDKNFLFFHKEPYGVSKNIRAKMSPPKFKDACFEIKPGETINMSIELR